ncbi:MAG: glycosyltransferase family 117 protein [Rubrobacter sp.]
MRLWSVFTLVVGVLVGLVAFRLYFRTLAPTILYYDPAGMYDSLMLQVKAAVLGIPNPTGYPTYMMLVHLFTYLPIEGGAAYKVNLASAVFGAAAVAVVFFVCRMLTGRIAPAVVGALLFAISRTFWSQAVITEVYTLSILFIALDLLALFLWRKTSQDKYLLAFAFLMGLSMTNHMTSGLVLPAAALFIVLTDWRKVFAWRLVLKGAGLFALGLLPYVYLPVRAVMDPPLNEADPSTPGRFLALVTGSNFRERMFVFGWDEIGERLSHYAGFLANQFNPLFLVVAAFGAFALSYRRDVATLAMLCSLYLGWLIYGMQYEIRDYFLYFIPTYLIVCILVACGLGAALDLLTNAARNVKAASLPRPKLHGFLGGRVVRGAGLAVVAGVSLVMLALPLPGLDKVYADVDMSEDYHGLHIMNAVIEGTAPGSSVVQNGGVMYYMKYVAGERPDLEVIDPFPSGGWQAESQLWVMGAVEALGQGRRAYVIFPSRTAERNEYLFWSAGYELVEDRSGFFYEVVSRERDVREFRIS